MIKNMKLEMKCHKTVKPSYVYYQPRQQKKAMNKYQSHLPARTVHIKKLGNQHTQLEKLFTYYKCICRFVQIVQKLVS